MSLGTEDILLLKTQTTQQFAGKFHGDDVHEFALQLVLDLQRKADDHDHVGVGGQMLVLEGIEVMHLEGAGRRDVDGVAKEVGKSSSGGTHHLVHNLAHRADGQLVEFELAVIRFLTHEDVNDDLDILFLEQHDVAAFETGNVLDLDAHRRLDLCNGKTVNINHRDLRRGNIHTPVQHIGHGSRRRAKADIHHFAQSVYRQRAKNFSLHPFYSLLLSA